MSSSPISMSPLERTSSRLSIRSTVSTTSIKSLGENISKIFSRKTAPPKRKRHSYDGYQSATLANNSPITTTRKRRFTLGGERSPPSYRTASDLKTLPILEEEEILDDDNMAWGKPPKGTARFF